MIPGEIVASDEEIVANHGRETKTIDVVNIGDRPIQVGSHHHFYEVNRALEFDRPATRGFRLNIPSGTAVRFEPGDHKNVELVALAGLRRVYGFRNRVNGPLDAPEIIEEQAWAHPTTLKGAEK
ncbi:urease subunit beta [Dermatophilus congolensis]|uniref:urease subunit beta n=1 Tax=Dermatophilus congolensis TaxID=1863 RepID=UPI001AAFEFBE|nr:urease subunit beta [Dermatophilus congolensis]MBO3130437.1 urease subunit beta [Dermatophilus congolensis]MBO3130932.1 urease subunit beta [Dermatophilus congolensis]MBO3134909.1 urease subunit beta [Dermatophilus congolensis]MBO3137147.1 urease subunit beta [Dermatophilus congolensis]MBO3139391.1 urease subunit beta [Dermatophilus congolensis]